MSPALIVIFGSGGWTRRGRGVVGLTRPKDRDILLPGIIKEAIDYGNLEVEDKNCSTVGLYVGG